MLGKIPNKEYKYILENMPVFCVDMILCKDKKVLLAKRKNNPGKGKWWVPGGRILKNEKINDAVIRKMKEEMGIKAKIKKDTGIYEYFSKSGFFPDLISGTHNIAQVFVVEMDGENQRINLDSQGVECKWISDVEESLDPYIKKILIESKVFD